VDGEGGDQGDARAEQGERVDDPAGGDEGPAALGGDGHWWGNSTWGNDGRLLARRAMTVPATASSAPRSTMGRPGATRAASTPVSSQRRMASQAPGWRRDRAQQKGSFTARQAAKKGAVREPRRASTAMMPRASPALSQTAAASARWLTPPPAGVLLQQRREDPGLVARERLPRSGGG